MSSLNGILSVARRAIAVNQAAMQVTSHNIANAQTEGYSRQVAQRAEGVSVRFPYGSIGTGVMLHDVVRLRDAFLDATVRQETDAAAGHRLRADLLGRVEELLAEPSDAGLAAALDAFWNAWSDLSVDPLSASARAVVQQRGLHVANTFNRLAAGVTDRVSDARTQLASAVTEINDLLSQVAELNAAVSAAESGGTQAPDLRDARDRLADRLAQLGISRAEYQRDGSLSIYIGGVALVSGPRAAQLEVRPGSSLTLGVVGDPDPVVGASGALAALVDFVNVDAPAIQARLDALARAVVNGVNEYHASGWTAAGDALGGANWDPMMGPTGSRVNFFDAAGTTAATMRLDAGVATDTAVIAAGDVQGAPGNNAVALALSALRDVTGMDDLRARMGPAFAAQIGFPVASSYATHYRATVTGLGLAVSQASAARETHETLAMSATARRLSVSGVSLDEELTRMIEYQQAFVAATRIVTVVDEMAESLLSMV